MQDFIKASIIRAREHLDAASEPLLLLGFAEAAAVVSQDGRRIDRKFVLPGSENAIVLSATASAERNRDNAYGVYRPGNRADFVYEAKSGSSTVPVIGKLVRKAAQEILEKEKLFNVYATRLAAVYDYLFGEGYRLLPVEPGMPFVFAKENDAHTIIRRDPVLLIVIEEYGPTENKASFVGDILEYMNERMDEKNFPSPPSPLALPCGATLPRIFARTKASQARSA